MSRLWEHEVVKLPKPTIQRIQCVTPPPVLEKVGALRDMITRQIHDARRKVHRTWVKHGRHCPEPDVSNKVILSLTYRLRVLANLPDMIDLVREKFESEASSLTTPQYDYTTETPDCLVGCEFSHFNFTRPTNPARDRLQVPFFFLSNKAKHFFGEKNKPWATI